MLSDIQNHKDITFEISCIKARMSTLNPILESTERGLRLNLSDTSHSFDEGSAKVLEVVNKLEDRALSLWNVIEINNSTNNQNKDWYKIYSEIILEIMHFSCMLLSIHALIKDKENLKFRVLHNYLKYYYKSIDIGNENSAKQAKEYINNYINNFEAKVDIATNVKFQALKIEFYMLEMHASILANDLSMAKYFEGKANLADKVNMFHKDDVLNLCRSLFNDALQLYKEDKIDDAFYFLEKCFLVLEKLQIDRANPENKVKVSTLIMLSKCCIKINTIESIEKAEKMIKYLSVNESKKIEALKLELELIQQKSASPNEIEDDLMKFVISIPIDPNILTQLRLLFNSFADKHPLISKKCLMYLFTNKINFQSLEFKDAAESYLISIIWIITSKIANESMDIILNHIALTMEIGDKKIISELSIETSNSIVVMLFSAGRKCIKGGNFEHAIRWFDFCTTRMFNNFKNAEVLGKIQRSILQSCLETNNHSKFDSCWKSMSSECQQNPLSKYYRFKSILKSESENITELCEILDTFGILDNIKVIKLLALCVIDCKEMKTQSVDFKHVLNKAMSRLIDKSLEISGDIDISLIVVALRSCFLINGNNIEHGIDVEKSVALINRSIDQLQTISKNNSLPADKEWFACHCYNYGIYLFDVNGSESWAIDLFSCCAKLINVETDHNNIKWYCKAVIFKNICISKHLKSGLKYNNELIIDSWKNIFNDCKKIIRLIGIINTSDKTEILKQCNLTLLDALIESLDYDEIFAILKDYCSLKPSSQWKDVTELDFLMESLLEKERELGATHFASIKHIIETIFIEIGCSKLKVGLKQLFKWLFLMVSKLLDNHEFEETLLKVIKIFKEQYSCNKNDSIATTELEWLAGMCWNHGISCIILDETENNRLEDLKDNNNTEDSSLIEENAIFQGLDAIQENQTSRSMIWCKMALLVSENHLQQDHMQNLLFQLQG